MRDLRQITMSREWFWFFVSAAFLLPVYVLVNTISVNFAILIFLVVMTFIGLGAMGVSLWFSIPKLIFFLRVMRNWGKMDK